MVSNSAKLDCRTKQHIQFGVSATNGSRDMARTKSRWKKRKKNFKKINNEADWMVSYSAKLDSRNKQHTQFGVSASNGSRDMARTKVPEKKEKKKNERRQSHKVSPMGIANNETGSRSPCMRPRSDPPKFGPIECGEKQTNNETGSRSPCYVTEERSPEDEKL